MLLLQQIFIVFFVSTWNIVAVAVAATAAAGYVVCWRRRREHTILDDGLSHEHARSVNSSTAGIINSGE